MGVTSVIPIHPTPPPPPSTDPIPHHLQRGLLIIPVQYENAFLCTQEQVLV